MTPLPPCGHGQNEQTPGLNVPGFSFSPNRPLSANAENPCSGCLKGVDAGTPASRIQPPAAYCPGEADYVSGGDWLTSLDPSKQSCNDEDDATGCKLEDRDLPPPEWQFQPISLPEAGFWFSGCKHERKAVYEALIVAGCRKALHRYVNCGSGIRVLYKGRIGDEHSFRLVANGCRNRWCPRCSRLRSNRIGFNVRCFLRDRDCRLRFVTLTLRHNKTSLRDQLKRLTTCFNNMKRRDWWKAHVPGGMMFIEVKLSGAKLWHVHAHIICEGKYMPQQDLSNEWLAVTGDSPIVDVREIKNPEAAASYVAKYGSKSFGHELLTEPRYLAECMLGLKGSRLCTTFGTWRGKKLTSMDSDDDGQGWQDLGTPSNFCRSEWFALLAEENPQLALRLSLWFRKTESG